METKKNIEGIYFTRLESGLISRNFVLDKILGDDDFRNIQFWISPFCKLKIALDASHNQCDLMLCPIESLRTKSGDVFDSDAWYGADHFLTTAPVPPVEILLEKLRMADKKNFVDMIDVFFQTLDACLPNAETMFSKKEH